MSDREPKFIVADRPVNRRTALRDVQQRERAKLPQPARVLAAQARNRLGPPLAGLRRTSSTPDVPTAARVAGGILASCGAVGGFLAWLHAAPVAGVVAVAALVGGGILGMRKSRARGDSLHPGLQDWLDPAAIAAFDRAIEQLGPELPPERQQQLAAIKQVLLRILRHPASGDVNEHFRPDDRLYVNECLHRYLPDSLGAYVAVPAAQRGVAVSGGQDAEQLLASQLALLHEELARRESALAHSAAEALLRQQRFLDAKARE